MIEAFLVPEKTVATAKGDGLTLDLGSGYDARISPQLRHHRYH